MARLFSDGAMVVEQQLTYAGESSTFSGKLNLTEPGSYQLQVLAMDAGNANFGMATRELEIVK